MPAYQAPMKDGEAVISADYRSWPKMLSAVQRLDAKRVRELYIDPMGYPFNRSRVASTAGSVEGAPGLEDARVSPAASASWPWGLSSA